MKDVYTRTNVDALAIEELTAEILDYSTFPYVLLFEELKGAVASACGDFTTPPAILNKKMQIKWQFQ
ncbi:hypothetical protein C5167_000702 [Papaver somniferum]|uniref:Uncharacterized protein n=1 Tax=Papaver somniferum TaxID=3469 RepID=A0A4Y7KUE6_PAPSO|nr:hypothetical protein C5167_000702 [Papaver somniferum]